MRHHLLPVLAQGNDRQFKVDPSGILFRQLVNLGYVDEAHREKLKVLVGVFQKVFDPFHGLGVKEQVGPLHVFIAAQTPELHGVRRLGIDVIEDELPVVLRGFRRVLGLAIGMVEFVAEGAFDRALLPQAQGNFPRVHFADQYFAISFALEHQRRLQDRQIASHCYNRPACLCLLIQVTTPLTPCLRHPHPNPLPEGEGAKGRDTLIDTVATRLPHFDA